MNIFIKAVIFTQLNVKNIYHQLWVCENDEWKTAFHTKYKLFKYLMMLFELINTLTSFQSYINKTLYEYINVFVVIYLDDIIIYSSCEKNHKKYIQQMLQTLTEADLYMKLNKCKFDTHKINFLSYMIISERISMKISFLKIILL